MSQKRKSLDGLPVTTATPRATIEGVPVFCVYEELSCIDIIKPNPQNPNRHPENQIQLLSQVIKAQGWRAPITVSKRSGLVVRGHCRLEAARLLGLHSVPVDFQEYATEAEEWADLIADNRLAELAEIDNTALIDLMQSIGSEQLELTGYTSAEMEVILQEIANSEPILLSEDDDECEDLPENPYSRTGDLWMLGRHRLLCGDSTKQPDVERLMDGHRARLIFTDPPWNVDYGSDDRHPTWKSRQILNDSMTQEEFTSFLSACVECMKSVIEPGCMTYIVMSGKEWGTLMDVMQTAEFHWSSTIIWHKDTLVLSRKDYHTQHEPIWYGWLEGRRLCPLKDRTQSDVWDIPRPRKSDEHPTMKPIELVVRAIQNSSHINDIALDSFGGSGTTLIAAEKSKRICFMMEMDPRWIDVIVNRYVALAGQEGVYCMRDGKRLNYAEIRSE